MLSAKSSAEISHDSTFDYFSEGNSSRRILTKSSETDNPVLSSSFYASNVPENEHKYLHSSMSLDSLRKRNPHLPRYLADYEVFVLLAEVVTVICRL